MGSTAGCSIRLGEEEDLLDVLSIHSRLEAAGRRRRRASAEERQTWARMMATPDLTVYLAECDDDIVGSATLLVMPNVTYGCAPTAFIEAVVVIHTHRRQGIRPCSSACWRMPGPSAAKWCSCSRTSVTPRMARTQLYTELGFEPEAEGFRLYLQRVPDAVQRARSG